MVAVDISTLVDTFTTGISAYWNILYGSPSAIAGWCLIPCQHSGGVPQYAGIQSTTPGGGNTWTIASSSTSAEILVPPNGSGATAAYLRMAVSSPNSGIYAAITYDAVANTLIFGNYVGGVDASAVTIPYISTLHRWWRIRNDPGRLYWDTSADGATWTNRRTLNGPGAWLLSTVYLGFEASRNGGTNDSAVIDNVSTHTSTATVAAVLGSSAVPAPSLSTGATVDDGTAAGAGVVSDPTLSAGATVAGDVAVGVGVVPDVEIVTSASSIMSPPPTLFVRFPLATLIFAESKAFAVSGSAETLGLSGGAIVRDLTGSAYVV